MDVIDIYARYIQIFAQMKLIFKACERYFTDFYTLLAQKFRVNQA